MGRCSGSTAGNSTAATEATGNATAEDSLATAVTAQKPQDVAPLDRASLKRGVARVAVAASEGLSGEMIYSRNCYDALGRTFTWTKLDECGGFDVAASRALGDAEPVGADQEVSWFASEAVAGRHLKAATAAGLDAAASDARLAEMQKLVWGVVPPHAPTDSPPPAGTGGVEGSDDGGAVSEPDAPSRTATDLPG